MTSPTEAGFAPAGKRLKITGAVDEVSPFPVANSPETTLLRQPMARMRDVKRINAFALV
jgi:hypothetical protein